MLDQIVSQTGLANTTDGKYIFIHDVFKSYFLAMRIANESAPDVTIWKNIDPFRVGWVTIQYICEIWEKSGKDISAAVGELLSFGDAGEVCVAEVCISCTTVSDKVVSKFSDRIIRDMYSTGPTIFGVEALTRLAVNREVVLDKLIDCAYSDRLLVGGKVEFASCVLNSGHLDEALEILEVIAEGKHEYQDDRIRSAELLCTIGRGELGRSVLAEMARDADELWMRAEAAVILFQNDRSETHRQLVAKLLQEEPDEEFDIIFESTITRLLSLGDKELALPAIRNRAQPPVKRSGLGRLDDQIEACKAIAAYHDVDEAASTLKSLLSLEHISVRVRAEVLGALADIGAEEFARDALLQVVGNGPTYDGADWFVLELLGRFDLDEKLRAVGLYLLQKQLTDSPKYLSDVDSIVEKLSGLIDHGEIADLIRDRLRSARDTKLASCLATLGFREEARNLLSTRAKDKDFDSRIDAARELCLIGERDLGVRLINRLVRDVSLRFDTRLEAADSLTRVKELDAARKAFTFLLCDRTLAMKDRCRAAQHFDEEGSDNGELIWEHLFPQLIDDDLQLEDRIVIAETLLGILTADWSDFDQSEVADELIAMLGTARASSSNTWKIVSILADCGYSIDEISGALALADESSIPIEIRIGGLKNFVFRSSDKSAAKKLIEIAQLPEVPYKASIDALSSPRIEKAYEGSYRLLELIVNDPVVPPAWRLAAASEMPRQRGKRRANEYQIAIIRDARITASERLVALKKLQHVSTEDYIELLEAISGAPNLEPWSRLSIVEAALQAEAIDFAKALLNDALLDTPYSIAELVKMAELFHAVGDSQQAIGLLEQIAGLPDDLLEELDDHSSTIEAAELLAKFASVADSKSFLHRIVRLASWHDLADILSCIKRVAGENDARQAACALLPELILEPNDPSNGYMGYWRRLYEEFLANGWANELSPLLIIAQDTSKLLSDRAEAAAAIYRNSFRDPSRNWAAIAQSILTDLSSRKDLSAPERTDLLAILKSCGLGFIPSDTVDWPSDRGAPKEFHDDEDIKSLKAQKAFNAQEPIMDRLFDLRDLVSDHGNKEALRLIFETVKDEKGDPHDRLLGLDVLEELGYRAIPMEFLPEILSHPEVDSFWAGELLLRFGDKSRALKFFERAIETCPESYRDQIARELANLQASSLLEKLNAQSNGAA